MLQPALGPCVVRQAGEAPPRSVEGYHPSCPWLTLPCFIDGQYLTHSESRKANDIALDGKELWLIISLPHDQSFSTPGKSDHRKSAQPARPTEAALQHNENK